MSDQESLHPEKSTSSFHPLALVLGLIGLAIYLFTQAKGPEPGMNIKLLNELCGLNPTPSTVHLPYFYLSRFFAGILPGSIFSNLNLFSALMGSITLVAFFHIHTFLPYFSSVDSRRRHKSMERKAALVGAVVATLLLLISDPLWTASTRAGTYTFDMVLMLACFYLLMLGVSKRSARWPLNLGVFLYGLGITEYATMFIMAPVFLLLTLFILLRRADLSSRTVLTLFVFGLLGLSAYLLPILVVSGTTDLSYGQYTGYLDVLVQTWRRQYIELKAGIPKVGSILIVLTCFAPWAILAGLAHPKRSKNIWVRASSLISMLLLIVLGWVILAEYKIPPSLFAQTPIILPYISLAGWLGYLAGYWYLYAHGSHALHKPIGAERVLGIFLVAVITLAAPVCGYLNYNAIHGPGKHHATEYAENIVESLGSEPFFLSHGGTLDELITHLAWKADKPKEVLSLRNLAQESYRYYLRDTYPEYGFHPLRPESVSSFVKAVLEQHTEDTPLLAFAEPEMLNSLGFQARPRGLVYYPAANFDSIDAQLVDRENNSLFDKSFAAHRSRLASMDTDSAVRESMLMAYSRAANNVGALLLFMQEHELALAYFNRALTYFPNNPSTHLNIREYLLEKARANNNNPGLLARANEALQEAKNATEKLGTEGLTPSSFSSRFGIICSEQVALWATQRFQFMGSINSSAVALNQAQALSPNNPDVQMRGALQALITGETPQALSTYEKLIQEDPLNTGARLSYATTLFAEDSPDKAIQILREHPSPDARTRAFTALLLARLGQPDQARKELALAENMKSASAAALTYLALTYDSLGDTELAQHYAEIALKEVPHYIHLYQILIRIALEQNDLKSVINYYEKLAEYSPNNIPILERILGYAMALGEDNKARNISEQLLVMDANNFLANYTLAWMALDYNQYEQMERYLRICVKHTSDPRYDIAANNLAYALLQQDRFDEALAFAKESTIMNPSNDEFQHTLAEIHLKAGRLDEAQKAMDVAMTKAPNKAKHRLLQAEIFLAEGKDQEAKDIARDVLASDQGDNRKRAKRIINTP